MQTVPYRSWKGQDHGVNDYVDFRSDYLGEYEAICETALARESVP
jgi:hypothetical protein